MAEEIADSRLPEPLNSLVKGFIKFVKPKSNRPSPALLKQQKLHYI